MDAAFHPCWTEVKKYLNDRYASNTGSKARWALDYIEIVIKYNYSHGICQKIFSDNGTADKSVLQFMSQNPFAVAKSPVIEGPDVPRTGKE